MTGAVGHFTAVTHHKCHTNTDWLKCCALFTEIWPFKGGLSPVGGGRGFMWGPLLMVAVRVFSLWVHKMRDIVCGGA